MRIEGAVRREQLASILFALLAARPDSPEWCAAMEAVAVATGLIDQKELRDSISGVDITMPPVVVEVEARNEE